MQLRSRRDLDLRSNFDLDLLRSTCIFFEASGREEHDGARILSLSCLVQKLSVKNHIEKVTFTFHDLWSGAPPRRWKWGDGDQAAAKPGLSSEGNPYQKPKTQQIWPTIFLKMRGIIPRTPENGGRVPTFSNGLTKSFWEPYRPAF